MNQKGSGRDGPFMEQGEAGMEGIREGCSRRTLDNGLSTAEPGATTSPATVAAHSTSTHTEVETRPVGPAIRDIPSGLADLGTVVSLTRGTAAYHEGDPASHWYRMVSGTGCTSKLLSDGRRQIGRFLHAEDFFGFEAVEAYGFGAEALTDMVVIRYPKRGTEALAGTDGAVGRCFREITCRSLAIAYDRLLTLGRKTASERVATFLLELADAAADGRAVSLEMSRADIADYLGLTLGTISRTLADFKHAGLIDMAGPHHLVLLDRRLLEKLAEGDEPATRAEAARMPMEQALRRCALRV
ncbi:cyclic nucleotide-binding domain-containing protein [Mycobacterium sp. KBS0706]|uniref:helix-turn-helix domain-containing protein n=1 Tax=Mycobacterium sp. KBS0706 TaxID=2578109 RepID=UPI00110FD18F|nr:helix-turn-helix domain-containing protein [Mycobacterium sp. KBS0706]TSD83995.1 cyclic nucleotide-binding domain-containing protein [Mycobacterium sp. KBS0706]